MNYSIKAIADGFERLGKAAREFFSTEDLELPVRCTLDAIRCGYMSLPGGEQLTFRGSWGLPPVVWQLIVLWKSEKDPLYAAAMEKCLEEAQKRAAESGPPIADGVWCWVWIKNDPTPFPAMRSRRAAGGWTNTDTWEDFGGDVVRWEPIAPASDKP